MLTDNQILKLINNGVLTITPELTAKQFQPTSLDWRIGAVEIFDKDTIDNNQQEYLRLFSEGPKSDDDGDFIKSIDDFLDSLEGDINYFDKENFFILEPDQQAIIYSREQFEIPKGLSMYSELRSSNGRRGLSPRDGRIQDLSYDGRVTMSVVNKNPNPLKFYEGDRFAQLFFEVEDNFSYVPLDSEIVQEISNSQIMNEKGIYNLIARGLLEVSPEVVINLNFRT